jgi:hypothetical protein
MPDSAGRFRGISVPEIPWHQEAAVTTEQKPEKEPEKKKKERPTSPVKRLRKKLGSGRKIETSGAPRVETR